MFFLCLYCPVQLQALRRTDPLSREYYQLTVNPVPQDSFIRRTFVIRVYLSTSVGGVLSRIFPARPSRKGCRLFDTSEKGKDAFMPISPPYERIQLITSDKGLSALDRNFFFLLLLLPIYNLLSYNKY
jgi:hypothetical protein